MNYLTQMLLNQPAVQKKPKAAYAHNKVQPKYKGSELRYRTFLTKQRRTIPEIAEHMGYTYGGTRASVLRMVARGVLKRVQPRRKFTRVGRTPDLYTWVLY